MLVLILELLSSTISLESLQPIKLDTCPESEGVIEAVDTTAVLVVFLHNFNEYRIMFENPNGLTLTLKALKKLKGRKQ